MADAPPALKTPFQIRKQDELARELFTLFVALQPTIRPGASDRDLEKLVLEWCRIRGFETPLRGYKGFPAIVSISIAPVIAHGIPCGKVLANGDLVMVDMVLRRGGWCADGSWTYLCGDDIHATRPMLELAWRTSVLAARAAAGGGAAVARAAAACCKDTGALLMPQFAGHGIGREIHEAPRLPLVCRSGSDTPLPPGTVCTVEPVLVWNCPAADLASSNQRGEWLLPPGGRGAMFELMVAVEGREARILGVPEQWTRAGGPRLPF